MICLSDVYSNTGHSGRNSDFVPTSADTSSRYQVLEGNFDVSGAISPLPSLGCSQEGWVWARRGHQVTLHLQSHFIPQGKWLQSCNGSLSVVGGDFYFRTMQKRLFREKPPQHLSHTVCCVQKCIYFFDGCFCFVRILRWNQRSETRKLASHVAVQLRTMVKLWLIFAFFVISGKEPHSGQWLTEAEANFSVQFKS